jgi:hypothetical protein
MPVPTGEYTFFIIDLSGPEPFSPINKDSDPLDDRITWRSAPGTYATGEMSHRAVRFDKETRTLYIGKSAGYDTLRLDPNLTGTATYTYLRAKPKVGIDYANPTEPPIRGALVELKKVGTPDPLQTTNTDENGFYTFFGAPIGVPLEVVVTAVLGTPPPAPGTPATWIVAVVDNTNSNEVYKKSSGSFTLTPTGSHVKNVLAKTTYNAAKRRYVLRDGAPFALLDDIYQAHTKLRSIDPAIKFDFLRVAWSPKNSRSNDEDIAKGRIRITHYNKSLGTFFVLGKENSDTDEYDTQVVLHEWTHYFQDKFSRDDSPGGSHWTNDVLDPRLALSEGFATAFAAMLTDDPVYVDTIGPAQSKGADDNIENDSANADSFYSESAVRELLWDLYDGTATEKDIELGHPATIEDNVSIGFKPILDAVRNGFKDTPAFTAIFGLMAEILAPLRADPLRASTVSNIVALGKGENIFLDAADQFEQSTPKIMVIPQKAPKPPKTINIGRLHTPVPVTDTSVSTFGPQTPYDGQPLETNTRYDPQSHGNKLDEGVYFKFEVPPLAPGGTGRRKYEISVRGGADDYFRLQVNQAPGGPVKDTGNPETNPDLTVCLEPGPHAVLVRGFDVGLGNVVPATKRFSIRIKQIPPLTASCTP